MKNRQNDYNYCLIVAMLDNKKDAAVIDQLNRKAREYQRGENEAPNLATYISDYMKMLIAEDGNRVNELVV